MLDSPLDPLNVSVVTDDEEVLKDGDKVELTVTVGDGSNSVEGAAVHIDVTTGNGNRLALDGTTDGDGEAEFKIRVNAREDGCGKYTVDAIASKHEFNPGSGLVTYDVACSDHEAEGSSSEELNATRKGHSGSGGRFRACSKGFSRCRMHIS